MLTKEPTTPRNISKFTFSLAKCLMHLKNAETYAATIAREPEVRGMAKQMLNRVANRANAAIREFTDSPALTPASLEVIKNEVLPEEVCLQLESVSDMMLALPKGVRDECERYIESRYNIYKLN